MNRSFFLFLFIFLASDFTLLAELKFRQQLPQSKIFHYKHWNLQKKEITGHTEITYRSVIKDDKEFILAQQRNLKTDGTLFWERLIWFHPTTGAPVYSQEKDYRAKIEISSEYQAAHLITTIFLPEKEQHQEFSLLLGTNVIPFELLTLWLQKQLPQLIRKKELNFILYLPRLAYELEKTPFPRSMAELSVKARMQPPRTWDSPMGKVEVVDLLVVPTDFLVKSLLPKEQSEFRFTFLRDAPHNLVSFQEKITQSLLIEIRSPK